MEFNRSLILRIISFLIGFSLLLFIFSETDGKLVEYISEIGLDVFIVLLLTYCSILVFDIIRLLYVFHPSREEVTLASLRGAILAPSLNMLLPARAGDVNALVKSKSSSWAVGQRTRNLVLLRLTDVMILATFSFVLINFYFSNWLLVALMACAVIGYISAFKFLPSIVAKFAGVLNFEIGDASKNKVTSAKYVSSLGLSFLFWIFQGSFTYFLLISMGVSDIGFIAVISILSFATLSKSLPITPGGIGLYEGILAISLSEFGGIDSATATSLALMDGVFRYLFTSIIPWVFLTVFPKPKGGEEE